jgi:hypothetical protein
MTTQAKTVTVTVRRIYGMPVIYPADANARSFAAIAGTKTLARQTVRHIKNLGFEIVEMFESQLEEI